MVNKLKSSKFASHSTFIDLATFQPSTSLTMLQLLIKKLFYGLLVLAGVVVIVFFIFQAFADPARLIAGQTGDKKTMDNIRKELVPRPAKMETIFIVCK